MTTINNSFSNQTIELLHTLIGKYFNDYICDPFSFNNWVYQTVGLSIGCEKYCILNKLQTIDYFGIDEDICFFEFNKTTDIHSSLEGIKQITNPINATIKEIQVVEENQKLYENKELVYELKFVRGLVFIFNDSREIAFEKTDPFSEQIAISKGSSLLNSFSPLEQPDDLDPGIEIVINRETMIIN